MKQRNVLFLLLFCSYFFIYPEITGADARSIAMQDDGAVLVAGTAIQDKQAVIVVTRYLSNGVVDTSFGVGGIATTLVGDQAEANALLLQSTGKIIVAGFGLINGATTAVIVRYDINGIIDSTFGPDGNGILIEQMVSNAQIADIKQQSDGKIIVAGTYSTDGQFSAFLNCYSIDGVLDSSFGQSGLVTKTVGYHTGALGLAIQSDDKIIMCGFSIIDTRQVILMRFNSDGSDDTNYGMQGLITSAVGTSSQAEAIVIDANGNALVTGSSDNMLLLARYTPTGIPDTSFGTEGFIVNNPGNFNGAFGLALQADGALLACGFAEQMLATVRYTEQGILDISFNGTGYITQLIDNIGNCAKAITIFDNQIYVAGSAGDDLTIVRYNSDGSVDNTWFFSGIVDIYSGSSTNTTVIFDQKATGVDGGTFSAGTWVTRVLNQIVTSSAKITLANNRFTLLPGVYEISIAAPAYMCGNHKIRLQDITRGQTVKAGTAAFSSSASETAVSNSLLEVAVVVTNATDYEIQHRCSVTKNNNGFGIATGFDDAEVYTVVKIVEK